MNKTLNELYNEIYTKDIKSIEVLRKDPLLYSQFKEAVYNFLCSKEVSKAIYKATSTYYGKHGNTDVDGTVQIDQFNEKTKCTEHYNKKISLKDGELIHMYYTYLFTETKKKGANKGNDFFTIIFNNPEFESWIPTTVKSFSNWILDLAKTTKTTDSLDKSLTSDPEESFSLGEIISDNYSSGMISYNGKRKGLIERAKTPETTCISNIASTDMINSLAHQYVLSHPEDFVAFNWFLQNDKELFKPTDLYYHLVDILESNRSSRDAASAIVVEALNDLCEFGLNLYSINLKAINYSRIITLLDSIILVTSTSADAKSLKSLEKEIIAELSRWFDRCKHRFQKNPTVLSYK